MKRIISLTLILTAISALGFAQILDTEKTLKTQIVDSTEGWKTGGIASITMSQTSLTNWSSGGQNSMSMNGLLVTFARYKKGKNQWDNGLNIGYGLQKQGEVKSYMKTDDKIEISSKYGRQAVGNFFYSGLVTAKTQFSAGYNYPNDSVKISNWMAPAYLTVAIGMDYKPNTYLSAFLAPVTGRFTYVGDDDLANTGAFGVDPAEYDALGNMITPGKNLREEFGGYFRLVYNKSDYKSEILKNVAVVTKLDLFSNYLNNPENIDVSWETLIGLKVNKYLTVNLTLHLMYDDDIKITEEDEATGLTVEKGPNIQFKEILGVGIGYKW
ncbi:MAG: DUF3078 domain-containing protein [Breznakibacter sp.]|nr:DUF3078 domain-containing protein [Breznakibacter sp.]